MTYTQDKRNNKKSNTYTYTKSIVYTADTEIEVRRNTKGRHVVQCSALHTSVNDPALVTLVTFLTELKRNTGIGLSQICSTVAEIEQYYYYYLTLITFCAQN